NFSGRAARSTEELVPRFDRGPLRVTVLELWTARVWESEGWNRTASFCLSIYWECSGCSLATGLNGQARRFCWDRKLESKRAAACGFIARRCHSLDHP